VSPLLSSMLTAAGGVLAGLALAGPLLWRQQRALHRARHDADHDDTTGLPNRRALVAALTRRLRGSEPCGVVLLDLDGFKAINDRFGHEVGNDALTEVGYRLAALVAPVRLAARLSGDEFALLIDGGPEQVAAAADAAWRAVSRDPVRLGHRDVAVYPSVGHATAGPGATARTLLRRADMAMYEAKMTGSRVRAATTAPYPVPRHRRYRDLPRT
jgi:diguanylate cyclase (GGDEF)-like protein